MAEMQNRTVICSVVFIDIVEYSRKSVIEQLSLKDRFNALLIEAVRDIAPNQRIILDTGDGAAITFIGDPEDALVVAARLQESIAEQAEAEISQLAARIGINLGPVRLAKDINGQPNVIGDGINVGQHVMSFAQPGEVLVSRSYYEAVSRLSNESSKLFTCAGSHTDKHIREHEVYALALTATVAQKRWRENLTIARTMSEHERSDYALARASRTIREIKNRIGGRAWLAKSVAFTAMLAAAVMAIAYRDELYSPSADPSNELSHSYVSKASSDEQRGHRALSPSVSVGEEAQTRAAAAAEEATGRASVLPTKKAPLPATGVVDLAITPWGKIYVDGKEHGVSPPLRKLQLTEGKHKVEVRNAGFRSHVVALDMKPGTTVRIKHKFN